MNLPNRLTLLRVLFIPIIVFVYLFPFAQFNISISHFTIGFVTIPFTNLILLILFVLASITDFFDGYIARKQNKITSFGKFVDPVADKLLVNTLFILFAFSGIVPIIAVIIMIWRDIIVDAIRMMVAEKGKVMSAGYLGKVKTVLQMLTIILVLMSNLPFELYHIPVSDFMLWFAVAVSVMSGINYFLQAKDVILESM